MLPWLPVNHQLIDSDTNLSGINHGKRTVETYQASALDRSAIRTPAGRDTINQRTERPACIQSPKEFLSLLCTLMM